MRRLYRRLLPALTRFYDIKPWDLDDMPYGEVLEYIAQLPLTDEDPENAKEE